MEEDLQIQYPTKKAFWGQQVDEMDAIFLFTRLFKLLVTRKVRWLKHFATPLLLPNIKWESLGKIII